jgi:hypothetical protein
MAPELVDELELQRVRHLRRTPAQPHRIPMLGLEGPRKSVEGRTGRRLELLRRHLDRWPLPPAVADRAREAVRRGAGELAPTAAAGEGGAVEVSGIRERARHAGRPRDG